MVVLCVLWGHSSKENYQWRLIYSLNQGTLFALDILLGYGPKEFSSRKDCLHLTNWSEWNISIVQLKRRFRCRHFHVCVSSLFMLCLQPTDQSMHTLRTHRLYAICESQQFEMYSFHREGKGTGSYIGFRQPLQNSLSYKGFIKVNVRIKDLRTSIHLPFGG